MNNQVKSLTFLTVLCGLLVLSSGYLFQLQNWLVFNSQNSIKSNNINVLPIEGAVGIRTIVSESSTSIVQTSHSQIAPVSDSVEKMTADALQQDLKPEALQTREPIEASPSEPLVFSKNEPIAKELLAEPLIVELDDEILVEFPDGFSKYEIQKALARLLVVPQGLDVRQILSSNPIATSQKPYLYKKVLNQFQKPIRYPAQAYRYAEYLLLNESYMVNDEQGDFRVVKIPLNSIELPNKVKKYQAWVNQYANIHQVEPELVFAIIDVESNFNHRAVSKSNALGLMQIKANAAGRDVYKLVDGKQGQPSKTELFNPRENIRMGTAYVGLLQNNYLQKIRNPEKKEMVTISSYNGGIASVLKLFGKTPEQAINRINRLHPKQVYRTLRYKHHSDETKRYLEKVMKAKSFYSDLLELTA